MSFGNHQAAHVTHFEHHQLAGIGKIVGIAHIEQFAATIGVADGGDVLDPALYDGLNPGAGCLALRCSHDVVLPVTFFRIVANGKSLKNSAKVIHPPFFDTTTPGNAATKPSMMKAL